MSAKKADLTKEDSLKHDKKKITKTADPSKETNSATTNKRESSRNDSRKFSNSAKSLRELLADLDQIIAWFSSEDLDIEAAIAKFEAGAKLASEIREKLKIAKNHIEIVQKKFIVSDEDLQVDE